MNISLIFALRNTVRWRFFPPRIVCLIQIFFECLEMSWRIFIFKKKDPIDMSQYCTIFFVNNIISALNPRWMCWESWFVVFMRRSSTQIFSSQMRKAECPQTLVLNYSNWKRSLDQPNKLKFLINCFFLAKRKISPFWPFVSHQRHSFTILFIKVHLCL